MKFSEAWLRQWVDPPVMTDELTDQLTMAGLEVASVTSVAGAFDGVVIGEVLSREQHPNADKLNLCVLDVGQDESLQIICGAPNVRTGMKVPVAVIGASLPGENVIKKAKLRGVESQGMICSVAELGLADSADGIMPLAEDAPVGEDFREYLNLNDQAIDLDLTPERGDCLAIAGIAREIGVINRIKVTPPEFKPVQAAIHDSFPVQIETPEACPRYCCRIIRNINTNAKTPLWMQERLRRSDLRSISPVVDVTNYVMLELGQPMHGFDLRLLDSKIRVRMAKNSEKLRMLDGSELTLREDTLVIADAAKVVAIAGIMGGEHSGVTEETKDILLESAFFAPTAIIGKARSYGMHTDSSHRFERGVDPQMQAMALERATRLLLDITGGEPGSVVDVAYPEYIEKRPPILLRKKQMQRLLGVEIEDETVSDILTRLDMQVESVNEGWRVTAPSCRFDVGIEADLIEEIGRVYGYSKIPACRSTTTTLLSAEPEEHFNLDQAKQLLVDRDFQEVITYSFISREMHELMDPQHGIVELTNPISTDMAIMRTSLWPGLIQTAIYNQARQQNRIRIFESGLRFIKKDTELKQNLMLAGLITGPLYPEQWGEAVRVADFYDLKADVQSLLALTGVDEAYQFMSAEHPSLHPGQSAHISRDGEVLGWIGMLHPELEQKLDLNGEIFLFEIQLNALLEGELPTFRPLSKYPSIRRDIAIIIDAKVEFNKIKESVKRAASGILQDILLFDVYTGEKIDSGLKSLALGLILQESSHTLKDETVDHVVDGILQTLKHEFSAQLRD